MEGKQRAPGQQSYLFQDLRGLLDARHTLYRLAERMPWAEFTTKFGAHYSSKASRPSVPIRVMVSLLMLKHLENLSDERVIERWMENPFWQFFSGMEHFQWKAPCDPCELVRFRQRIGPGGCEHILRVTVSIHGAQTGGEAVVVDTTVQEKAIAPPRDSALFEKIAAQCVAIARHEGIPLRRSYRRDIIRQRAALRMRNFPRARKRAQRATRRLRTIAGRLMRDVRRKCSEAQRLEYAERFDLFERVLTQEKGGPDHIYSLHEPQVCCIGKGKDHKKYEFGAKVSIAIDATTGVIVSAMECGNRYDGHTVPDVLAQLDRVTDWQPATLLADRGYRGVDPLDRGRLLTPDMLKRMKPSPERDADKSLLRRRSAVEPVIAHLKSDHRLGRNFLKGLVGDKINVLLAASGWNLSKWLRNIFGFRLIQLRLWMWVLFLKFVA